MAAFVLAAAQATLPPGVHPITAAPQRAQATLVHAAGRGGFSAFPAGINETYGYPDGVNALIVEGPFAYPKGPATWSNSTPWGAYGMIIIPGKSTHGKCDPIPADSPFAKSGLLPAEMTNGGTQCLLSCNTTEVELTGVDPCHAGSIDSPTNSVMSCFNLGPGTAGGGGGACGYNCSAFVGARTDELVPCHAEDISKGACNIFCDSRTFPAA